MDKDKNKKAAKYKAMKAKKSDTTQMKGPILTQHGKEDTVREWGNPIDTNQKTQIPGAAKKKDYFEGKPGEGGRMRYHQ